MTVILGTAFWASRIAAGIFWTQIKSKLPCWLIRAAMFLPRMAKFRSTMRALFIFFRNLFFSRRNPTSRRNLLGMYFGESNGGGRRKSNRDRA